MNTERWQRVGDIFERLLEVPAEARDRHLESLCGADDELRGIVLSMLDSHEGPRLSDDSIATQRDASRAAALDAGNSLQRSEESAGSHVGHWRLARKIGAGGMGVVWLAERADGQFHQRAALKLVKRGMDSEAVLARFLRERQILARLEHRNIAHLLDGGIAADGRPYFAMEYVEGEPLLAYCTKNGLKLEERLRLFLQVCTAVRFAHSQHIVHRDIKPSNILVTADGSVKLLDFGIAKMLQDDGELGATLTATHREQPMTPAYAAPEQFSGKEVTEATDVYALGCVFYELLSGRRPHDFTAATNPHDVLKIILATDPVAPGKLKQADAPVPAKRLRGDLDTIALTALKQVPSRRYANVAAFAADIENYLGGKPIAARREHVMYRAYKFVRRHRSGVTASLVTIAALTVATFAFIGPRSIGYARTNASLAIVDFNNLAQDKDATWIASTLMQMLATELAEDNKMHALPDELVRNARADLAAPSAGGYAPQPLATLRKRLGVDYVLSGSYLVTRGDETRLLIDLALQDARSGTVIVNVEQSGALADLPTLVEKAGADLRGKLGFGTVDLSRRQQLNRAQPPSTDVARNIGLAIDALRKNDPATARDQLLQALALAPGYAPAYAYIAEAWKALGYDAKALAAAQQAAANSANLPTDLRLQIAREVAVEKFDWVKAIEIDKQLLQRDPQNPELYFKQIDDWLDAGNPDAAEGTLAELRKLPGLGDPRLELRAAKIAKTRGDPKAQAEHASLALRQANARDEGALAADAKRLLGSAKRSLGKFDEAQSLMHEAVDEYERIGNPNGEAGARTVLANLLADMHQSQAARDEYQRALAIYQRIGAQEGLAAIYRNLSLLLWSQGDADSATAAVTKALGIVRETGDLSGQAWCLSALATFQSDEAASDEALNAYREAIDLDERSGARNELVTALANYGDVQRRRGELDAANATCARARNEAKQMTNAFGQTYAELLCAAVALDRGEPEVASGAYARALNLAGEHGDSDGAASAEMALARIDIAYSRYDSARGRLMRAIATFAASGDVAEEAVAQSLVALCYDRIGQDAQRDQAAARARELRSSTTKRLSGMLVDIALSSLRGAPGRRGQAVSQLREIATDAEKRHWLTLSLEAKLAAWRLLDADHDPAGATLRAQIETSARQSGLKWVLMRLTSDASASPRAL